MAACSGQGKADKAAVVADSVVVKTDSVAADSTGYIVKVGEPAPDFTITLTDGKQMKLSELRCRSGDVAIHSQLVRSMP